MNLSLTNKWISHWNLFNIIPSYIFVDQFIINSVWSPLNFIFQLSFSSCISATLLFYLASISTAINSNCIDVLQLGHIFFLRIIMLKGTSLTILMFSLIFFPPSYLKAWHDGSFPNSSLISILNQAATLYQRDPTGHYFSWANRPVWTVPFQEMLPSNIWKSS